MSSRRGKLMGDLTLALREARGGLVQVSTTIADQVGIGAIDMEFLDLVAQLAPVTPGALASRTGLSPATVTGILDRLAEAGWIVRERDSEDRRRVFVRPAQQRVPELGAKFGPMLRRLSEIYAGYNEKELTLLIDFLRKVRAAGDGSVAELRARAD